MATIRLDDTPGAKRLSDSARAALGDPDSIVPTEFWRMLDDGRVQCEMCPRYCKLKEGARGLCFVRARLDDQIVLTTYGRSSGFCVDPVEKKPLNHFLPGSAILSLGTAGCSLACNFCQNHDISRSREMDILQDKASPEMVARAAADLGCRSVAFTYNDPTIFHEYAADIADACHERGIRTVAVTAGYLTDWSRPAFFAGIDAANVDLKGFTEEFYKSVTKAALGPVLDTLVYLKTETDVWVEVTTLLIPGLNDTDREIEEMTTWFVEHLGPDTPLHFSAFRPDYRMRDRPPTRHDRLIRAHGIAKRNGIRHVYLGNVLDGARQSTYCHGCGEEVIGRTGYTIGRWHLDDAGHCLSCGTKLSGIFDGPVGHWGARRRHVDLSAYAE
ncbi:AmmeMemoRadiSam system radical SAM enzyme [Rhodobium gokarnense]|uniref:Pyruvate formate lyase activating enzyme n=1 Tax=Rhodobium gokarnense TaxID=364296 RepID=A0ABT3H786_9HYPH|nr:AmmeMemoRadiSam system radical SAM enzyme [Rhodobium gokarnense]MCW2306255.1 pyruvate formate lyase activating enzyme [Rhodobium gokarnense]